MAVAAGVEVVTSELPRDLPMVTADRTRLVQILVNFGSNAIKYNHHDGKVTLVVSAPRADVVRIAVEDTGIGIAPESFAKLFQAFQRAGQENGPIEGTGIGLLITKRLAEMMEAHVGFDSVLGRGSIFWVDMPVHESGARSVKPLKASATSNHDAESGERKSVLYVEDNPANVTFMRDLLSSSFEVELITESTGEAGVARARAAHPNAIIMDINLPGMSGLDALRALKALPETSSIPVIALTAAATPRDRARGEQAGFHRYLTKPVNIDELEHALDEVLKEAVA
jgi:CheY-like chemotaxis protein